MRYFVKKGKNIWYISELDICKMLLKRNDPILALCQCKFSCVVMWNLTQWLVFMFVYIWLSVLCVCVMKLALWLCTLYRGLGFLWHNWPETGFELTLMKIATATARLTTQGKKQSRT